MLAPGFVDVHNHSDLGPLVDPAMASTLRQGVTTVVVGNCGTSPWPPAGAAESALMVGGDPREMDLRFDSFGAFLSRLEEARPAVNVAALVGHGAVRAEAMAWERRPPGPEELATMRRLVAEAMEQGAVGLSTGLIYAPGMYAATDEVVALAEEAATRGGVYASHIRGEGEHLFRAVDEALDVGRRAGLPVHVSHLKCETSLTWGQAGELLARVRGGGRDGRPVPVHGVGLRAVVAAARLGAGRAAARTAGGPGGARSARPRRGARRGRRVPVLRARRGMGSHRDRVDGGGRVQRHEHRGRRAARGVAPAEACFQLLVEEPETTCIGHAMVEEDVRVIMADPEIMVASDAASMSPEGPMGSRAVHPRNYGTFPRVLGPYVREGVLTLEAAVRKMTSLPADRFGLEDRGRVEAGSFADLVLFDPGLVEDRAAFGDPHAYPVGIDAVVVNGRDLGRSRGGTRRTDPATRPPLTDASEA